MVERDLERQRKKESDKRDKNRQRYAERQTKKRDKNANTSMSVQNDDTVSILLRVVVQIS